jgi:uncharacterized protein YccT (UPF0319 family)
MTAKQAAKKEKARRPARSSNSDEQQLEHWFAKFDAKVAELTARQDAFLHYLELHQPRQS